MIDRRLHVLRMVRQHGTVTAAAAALHLTPSAVSQQVRSLARDLDVELLQPVGRRVRLTRAAEVVLDHADRLHAQWEQARAELDAHRRGDVGEVRLSAFPSALAALLGPAVATLRAGDPPLSVVVVQADPAEARSLCERLQLEFEPFDITAEGLLVWRYFGGPWEAVARVGFGA